ncbi:aldo/keto reductase [Enterococcus timonensis]|uniref:aldo/keto reductase n=1 Tax=Enterococcus timonensis TaxID=1852364 RepID=UPI0008DA16B2|nr:aldo/keto reductase [Enterococcus timonensis]
MYEAAGKRYDTMTYRRAGDTGLQLPAVSLGLWRGHGDEGVLANTRNMIRTAFDKGIIHFDLANNYGPSAGSAESAFGQIMKLDMMPYRDEMIIASKAGFDMWDGPYGFMSSKKHLIASLDQSLKRTNLDYFDIFYTHRPDPKTSFEETAETLDLMVRQGKALYIGISNYSVAETKKMIDLFQKKGTPFVIHQVSYNMLNREPEDGLLELLAENNLGTIAYGPLAEGLLTDASSKKIPDSFQAHRTNASLLTPAEKPHTQEKLQSLQKIAAERGQSLSQMALAWLLRNEVVTSVVVGALQVKHLEDNIQALDNLAFSKEELQSINQILN